MPEKPLTAADLYIIGTPLAGRRVWIKPTPLEARPITGSEWNAAAAADPAFEPELARLGITKQSEGIEP
jgi:hypothetical protein